MVIRSHTVILSIRSEKMTKRDVITYIAEHHLIKDCIKNITGGVWRVEYDDLQQDLLIELYGVSEAKLVGLYDRNQLRFYLTRVVRNNIQSKTSRFFYRYRRFSFNNAGVESRAYQEAAEDES